MMSIGMDRQLVLPILSHFIFMYGFIKHSLNLL